jgi:hypothetical protein
MLGESQSRSTFVRIAAVAALHIHKPLGQIVVCLHLSSMISCGVAAKSENKDAHSICREHDIA